MNTLVDLLHSSAQRYAERPALLMRIGVRSIHYTYADLDHRAESFAAHFQSQGLQPGDRVVFWAPNQPDWVAAMFGAFMAGLVVVPLDMNCTSEFALRVIKQTGPRLALGVRRVSSVLREAGIPTLEFETLELLATVSQFVAVPVTADTLAEIVFTSGTTGDPKGVMLTHGNITANVESIADAVPLPDCARLLSLLPLSHMFEQVGGCFCPLSSGAAIRYPATRQPSALAELMREWRPTVLAGVPQLLSGVMGGIEREAAARGRTEMLESMRRAADRLPRVARRLLFRPVTSRLGAALEFVITGGAAVDPLLQHKWEQMGIDVLEGYGATECAPVITSNPLGHGRPGSVGRVLPRQELRIAEDGEVLTRGRNVFAGYWQNDAATSAVVQDGWYHTGDLGVLDADGFLWLKGRKKDLIVLSDGQNVYPDDVETVLKRQVGVADAVVLGLQRDGLIRVHAAIIESVPGAAAEAVRSANAVLDARQQVMGFTVWPDADFPRTHTLKIRRPLVLEYLQHQVLAPSAPAASDHGVDPLLHTIAGLYRGDNDISEDSTLGDDLGFDSLARVELLSAIEDDLGVYIDDTEVGAETTVSELRRLVAQREPRPKVRRFPEWSRSFPVRWIREAAQRVLVFPALCRFYHVEVVGAEHALLDRPVLVVSNHILHLDAAIIVASVPPRLRRHLAIAAAADDIFGVPWRGYGAALLGNAFPFSNDGSGVRDSLEYLARTLDDGWSVLIFPEGMLTLYGPMQPFKSGVGLVAVEARVPVLPLRIDVMRPGFGDRLRLPFQRGHVRVTFGEPLRFGPDTPYATAVDRLEDAVRGA